MRTHYGPWQPCWISNQHQKHKSGRGPSSEHFWQVWLISFSPDIIRKSFKKCGISNAIDGSEDNLFQNDDDDTDSFEGFDELDFKWTKTS